MGKDTITYNKIADRVPDSMVRVVAEKLLYLNFKDTVWVDAIFSLVKSNIL